MNNENQISITLKEEIKFENLTDDSKCFWHCISVAKINYYS